MPSQLELLTSALAGKFEIEREIGGRHGRAHYERCLFLWSNPDPEFQPMVAEATAALQRIG